VSEYQLAVIGTAVVYIAVFGFLSFLILWSLNCWWRVYQVCKEMGPLVKYINRRKPKGRG
jgi:hypothetical protein